MLYSIVNERTGAQIADSAWVADKPWNRMWGLLGRSGLAHGRAIILRPADQIHTVLMRFALDVVFADQNGTVQKVERNMRPFRFSSAKGARQVIEMASGTLPAETEPGDRLLIVPSRQA